MVHRVAIFGDTFLSDEVENFLSQRGVNFLRVGKYLDYHNEKVLIEIGISRDISIVFLLMESVEENIFLTLSIRVLDPTIQIFAKAENQEEHVKLKLAGANAILNYNKLIAQEIFLNVEKPVTNQVLDETIFQVGGIEIFQIQVDENSQYLGKIISEIELQNSVVLGILKDDCETFIFSLDDYVIQKNDTIILIFN
jgi:voltage-gated potassium channel